MPMIAGSVTIDPATGAASGAGCAKECFDLAIATMGSFPADPAGAAGKKKVADLCNAIAQGIITHIAANALVSVNVTGTAAAPIAVQVAPATGTGATTAPGAVTGSGTGTVA